jgi:hypothetical protein
MLCVEIQETSCSSAGMKPGKVKFCKEKSSFPELDLGWYTIPERGSIGYEGFQKKRFSGTG